MPVETLWLRKGIVIGSALIYWAGVFIQIRRVRRHIGRSPNVHPRGLKEKLLWMGWLLVVLGWFGQPFLVGRIDNPLFRLFLPLVHPIGLGLGFLLVAGGYLGTLWCYSALGTAWRMGVSRREKTDLVRHGPYRYVRHPIYLFQIIMLLGVIFLLPTAYSVAVLAVHLACAILKSLAEEAYLLGVHGSEYQDYFSKTGRFLPRTRD
jgi:protein-S-isoprenylcysteine O-methyltransferase Ste14